MEIDILKGQLEMLISNQEDKSESVDLPVVDLGGAQWQSKCQTKPPTKNRKTNIRNGAGIYRQTTGKSPDQW